MSLGFHWRRLFMLLLLFSNRFTLFRSGDIAVSVCVCVFRLFHSDTHTHQISFYCFRTENNIPVIVVCLDFDSCLDRLSFSRSMQSLVLCVSLIHCHCLSRTRTRCNVLIHNTYVHSNHHSCFTQNSMQIAVRSEIQC